MKKALAFFICTALVVSILISTPAAAFADETEPTPTVSPITTVEVQPSPDASPTPAPTVTSRYALLAGIGVTAGTWNKEFTGNVRSYILTLGETEESVTITPQKGDASQTFTINGRRVDCVTVNPDHGKHRHITIRVRQRGKRSRVYYVKVARERSSNNDLASLSVSVGTMESGFDAGQIEYNVALDRYSPFVTVTAAKADPHATLWIDGYRRIPRQFSVAPGAERTVKITVRSQTRVVKTYLVHITREAYPVTDRAEALIEFANHFIGTQYTVAGKTPAGFDCSGFVYYCLNGVGYITGYRTSAAWAAASEFETISATDELLPGDILCFKGHVGIYMGDDEMIDCSYTAGGVRTTTCYYNGEYWTKNFLFGKRVFNQEGQGS